jgi:hypothetical protein
VQELIPGASLQSLLAEAPQQPVEFVVQLLTEILEILVFVHSQDVIHRDIKPDNLIYRQPDCHWVLIDFGAVKDLTAAAPNPGQVSMAIYSKGYTPSEQAEGQPCPSSDLYSLGMLCLQCLSGQHPHTFKPHLRQEGLNWLTSVVGNTSLAKIFEKMTCAHWEQRYQTAQAVLEDLNAILPLSSAEPQALLQPEASNSSILPASRHTATEIRQPPPVPRLKIPVDLLVPQPTTTIGSATPLEPLPTHESPPAGSTAESSSRSWLPLPLPKLSWKNLNSQLWGWLKTHNIHRAQEAMAFAACLCLIGGASAFMLLWLAKSISAPRPDEMEQVSLNEPATSIPLIATLPGEAAINDLAFDAEATTVFSADATGSLTIWDLNSQQPIQNTWGFGAINALAVSTDGNWLASGDEYANITLRNLRSGKLLATLREHQLPILSLVFSPDGKTLVSSSEDNSLIIWDLETLEPQHQLTNFAEPITSIDISPDGQYLIGGSTDFSLKIWDIRTGAFLHSLAGHSGAIQAVAASSNGAIVVSGSADQSIKVWNLYTGKLINTLSGHLGAINTVATSPDGQMIISGGEDGTMRIWNPYSGVLLHKINDYDGPISMVKISADGQLIANSTATGKINIWHLFEGKKP